MGQPIRYKWWQLSFPCCLSLSFAISVCPGLVSSMYILIEIICFTTISTKNLNSKPDRYNAVFGPIAHGLHRLDTGCENLFMYSQNSFVPETHLIELVSKFEILDIYMNFTYSVIWFIWYWYYRIYDLRIVSQRTQVPLYYLSLYFTNIFTAFYKYEISDKNSKSDLLLP